MRGSREFYEESFEEVYGRYDSELSIERLGSLLALLACVCVRGKGRDGKSGEGRSAAHPHLPGPRHAGGAQYWQGVARKGARKGDVNDRVCGPVVGTSYLSAECSTDLDAGTSIHQDIYCSQHTSRRALSPMLPLLAHAIRHLVLASQSHPRILYAAPMGIGHPIQHPRVRIRQSAPCTCNV